MKVSGILLFLFQILSALVAGIFFYMVAVVMTVYDGILSMVFQPIMGGIFSVIAIILLLIIGLPIRLNQKLNHWWRTHWWLSGLLGAIGFISMILSWIPPFQITVYDDILKQNAQSFNPILSISGWLLLLFALLHFYFPPICLTAIDSFVNLLKRKLTT
jgi:hypothetical protein